MWGRAPVIVIDLGVTGRLPATDQVGARVRGCLPALASVCANGGFVDCPSRACVQERASVCLQIRELYVSLMAAPVPVELVVSSCVGPFRADLEAVSRGAWPVSKCKWK